MFCGWFDVNIEIYFEYYVKVGVKNLVVEFFIYDLESEELICVDVGGFGDEYIYGICVLLKGDVMMVNWIDCL